MLKVVSSRIGLDDPDGFDVTRRSGGPAGAPFAPSWDILRPALDARRAAEAAKKRGADLEAARITEVARLGYHQAFLAEMRDSYRRQRAAWSALLARQRVVLLCYCSLEEALACRCHRAILRREILPKLGAKDGGELPPRSKRDPQLGLR